MSNADWYAQRLAGIRSPQQQQPVAQPPQYPPTAPPRAPGQLPPHLAPYAAPPQPAASAPVMPGQVMPGQHHVPQSPQEVLAMVQAGQLQGYSYNDNGAQVQDDGHVAMLAYAAGNTGGSKDVRENTQKCPNCNQNTLFTIKEGGQFSKATGTVVHAVQCSSCNYPKVQAGSHGGSLGTARSASPAKQARQLKADHRVTVAVPGGGYATFDPPTGA